MQMGLAKIKRYTRTWLLCRLLCLLLCSGSRGFFDQVYSGRLINLFIFTH